MSSCVLLCLKLYDYSKVIVFIYINTALRMHLNFTLCEKELRYLNIYGDKAGHVSRACVVNISKTMIQMATE